MSHRDDPLWDGSEQVDAMLDGLRELLAPLAHCERPLDLAALPAQNPPRRRRVWPWFAVAAALLALAGSVLWWNSQDALTPGAAARDFVAIDRPLHLELGALAEVTLAPGSRLRFEHWRTDQALFHLDRGTLTARVAPPPAVQPGFFQVTTANGRVIDQGCRYELRVADDGTTHVLVTEGAVTFEFPQRTVFVPAGATTTVTAGRGPSTPVFVAARPELKKAVALFDQVTASVRVSGEQRAKCLEAIVMQCSEPQDSLVLWHLLRDDDPDLRSAAERALIRLVGPPEEGGKRKEETWDPEVWLATLRLRDWTTAK